MSKKRRRDPGTVDTQLVEIYEDLANESGEIRLRAAQSLLQKLSVDNSPSKEKVTDVLTRLVRGLCSGRKAARLGFSVAFTEFLVQHLVDRSQNESDRLGFSEVLDLLIKQTEIGGKVSGQVIHLIFALERLELTSKFPRKKEIINWVEFSVLRQ